MRLEFDLQPSYGHFRFYPVNAAAQVLVALTGRKCFNAEDLETLHTAGFEVVFRALSDEFKPFELFTDKTRRSI